MISGQLPSTSEMAAFDAAAIASGISGLELCEKAGRAVVERAVEVFPDHFPAGAKAVVLCGSGNNGADGLVIARHLRRRRIVTEVVIAAADRYSTEFIEQAKLFSSESGFVKLFPEVRAQIAEVKTQAVSESVALKALSEADVIFDAILGTGQKEAPRNASAQLLNVMISACRKSESGAKKKQLIIAVDIPTGINADSGAIYEPHCKADCTVAIQFVKRGMLQSPARECCGQLEAVPIGITGAVCEFSEINRHSAPRFPQRKHDTHKGASGRILVVAGNRAMTGAPILAGFGALRSGAGLVTVTRFETASSSVARPMEFIDLPLILGREGDGFCVEHLAVLGPAVDSADVVIFGPGIGRDAQVLEFTAQFVKRLLAARKFAVIDADALINLSTLKKLSLAETIVITPHPGEAAEILSKETSEVQADRYAAARALHEVSGAVAVLKGASTIVYDSKTGFVNTTANPWMATAGSGDTLCGVIAALIGQGLSPREAAILGVYLHGAAGDLAHAEHNGPIIASDIAAKIPFAIGSHRRG